MDPLENLFLTLFSQIEWVPVLVSMIVTFLIGWVWYSPVLFVKPWMNGLPSPMKWHAPMWMPMTAQLGATLLSAIIVNALYTTGQTALLVLVTLTPIGFIKANGMYSGKTKTTISIETLYILVMVLVMVATNVLL